MKIISYPTQPMKDAEWNEVAEDRIISGKPKSAYGMLYSSKSDEFHSGIYECTSGKWKVAYTEDEFCTLIEGQVRLTNEAGETQEFTAPCSFLIPSGYRGTWEAVTPVRKFFVIYEKAA